MLYGVFNLLFYGRCVVRMFASVRQALVSAKNSVARFLGDERAVSTVEYALIVVAIIAILGVAATALSGAFGDLFDNLANQMDSGFDNVAANAGM